MICRLIGMAILNTCGAWITQTYAAAPKVNLDATALRVEYNKLTFLIQMFTISVKSIS